MNIFNQLMNNAVSTFSSTAPANNSTPQTQQTNTAPTNQNNESLFTQDSIDKANEFLQSSGFGQNGKEYTIDDLAKYSELSVIMDENGTILGQMIDSDHDGKIDRIEYYNNDGFEYDTDADLKIDEGVDFEKDGKNGLTKSYYQLDGSNEKKYTKVEKYENNELVSTEELDDEGETKAKTQYKTVYNNDGSVAYQIEYTDEDGDGEFESRKKLEGEDMHLSELE